MALSTTQYGYIIDPMVPFTDEKGKTIKNGFVRVFVAGSSTPVITYRNFDGAANQDLIELDNSGRTKTSVIGSKGLTYKVCVYDKHHSQETPILTVDKVSVIGSNITAGTGATVVTGLDGLTTKPNGFVDASVVGTDGYVALDHTLVTDDLDTDAKVTAVENDRYIPLLNDDVNDPDSKMTLGRLWQWVLGKISNIATTITAFRTGDVIPVDGPSGTAKMSKDDLLAVTAQNAVDSGIAASNYTTISLTDSNNWVDGKVDASTGEIVADSTRVSTEMLPFKVDIELAVGKVSGVNYTTVIYCYDKFKNYLGYKQLTLSIANAVADFPSAVFFRLGLLHVSGVTPVTANNIANIITSWADPLVYKFLFVTEKMAKDIKEATEIYVDLNNGDNWVDGGTDTATGIIDPSRTDRLSTKMFPFTQVDIVVNNVLGVSFARNVYCYDDKKQYLGVVLNTTSIVNALATYSTAKFFRIGFISIAGVTPITANNISNICSVTNSYAYKFEFSQGFDEILNNVVNDKIKTSTEIYVDLNNENNWVDGGTDTATGIIDPSRTNRLSTRMFQFSSDVTFSYTKPTGVSCTGNIYCYDKTKKYLGVVVNGNSIADALTTYQTAVWFRFGLINISGVSPITASNIANIAAFGSSYSVKKYTTMSEFQALECSNKLFGKLWYACGDSFTEGVINGSTIPFGKYAGKKQVYPYLIGNRTGMDVMNIAVSGSTITYISGVSTSSNCFTYPTTGKLYTIPANAEYITLKFGINDSHKNVPIGTIDDTTNGTLYGAWNVAISYLLNNCPFAKIGIIVTNGCDSPEYSQAGKDIAKKWGLAYLDENFGYEVPLLHRVNGKPLVCAEAHQNRLENFRVSVDNTHPNDKAHEFESTFVEAWLRTL